MTCQSRFSLASASLILLALSGSATASPESRDFALEWTVRITSVPTDARELVLWIALPQVLPEQEVSNLRVTSGHPWVVVEDPDFGNRVVRATIADPPAVISFDLAAAVRRHAVESPRPAELGTEEEALYLREEALVTLSPRVHEIARRIENDDRARYDYVLKAMDYDKSVPGYGMGDTERACEVGKGNCTDFHSLFMSLSRARGVPALFEMGYPTKAEGEKDRIGGYHCWAWFYHDGAWVAVDISEADKDPEKIDYFFGRLDADRITFSRGRDVILPGMRGEPLNYLPSGAYVEVDGKRFESVTRSLSYTVGEPAS